MSATTSPSFEAASQILLSNNHLSNNNITNLTTKGTSSFNSTNNNSCFSTINLLMKDTSNNDVATTISENNSGTSCSSDSSTNVKTELPLSIPEIRGTATATTPKDFLNAMQMCLFPTHLIPPGFFTLPGLFGSNNSSGILNPPTTTASPSNEKNLNGYVENEATINPIKDIHLSKDENLGDDPTKEINDAEIIKKNFFGELKVEKSR